MTGKQQGINVEKSSDNRNTDTIPIPVLDIERKTVPVFCPWCDIISGVAKTDVMRFEKISPAYKACRKCTDFIYEGNSFPGRSSRLRQWVFSYCRRMCLKDMDIGKNEQ